MELSTCIANKLDKSIFTNMMQKGNIATMVVTKEHTSNEDNDIFPASLLLGNPKKGKAIYSGSINLANHCSDLNDLNSPFLKKSPNHIWKKELHKFSWLKDLKANNSELSRAQARTMISDWVDIQSEIKWFSKLYKLQWNVDILSTRIISWLQNAAFFLKGADKLFRKKFIDSIIEQRNILEKKSKYIKSKKLKLQSAIALTFTAIIIPDLRKKLACSIEFLNKELTKQILADGCHVSRDPNVVVDLMLNLIPLSKLFKRMGQPIPNTLLNSIDRMSLFIRTMLHGNNDIASFANTNIDYNEEIKAILKNIPKTGTPRNAPYAKYARLENQDSILLIDLEVKKNKLTIKQGYLPFEFSYKRQKLFSSNPELSLFSDVKICETSNKYNPLRWLYSVIIDIANIFTNNEATYLINESNYGTIIDIKNDAFINKYSYEHLRFIYMANNGEDIRGEDRFLLNKRKLPKINGAFKLRFNLHSSVKASISKDRNSVILLLPDKSGWSFTAKGALLKLETLNTKKEYNNKPQVIVISGIVDNQEYKINWALKRIDEKTMHNNTKQESYPQTSLL